MKNSFQSAWRYGSGATKICPSRADGGPNELNDVDEANETEELKKIAASNMPEPVEAVAQKLPIMLVKMNPSSAEYTVSDYR